MINQLLVTFVGLLVTLAVASKIKKIDCIEGFLNFPMSIKTETYTVCKDTGAVFSDKSGKQLNTGKNLGSSAVTDFEYFKPVNLQLTDTMPFQSEGFRGPMQYNINQSYSGTYYDKNLNPMDHGRLAVSENFEQTPAPSNDFDSIQKQIFLKNKRNEQIGLDDQNSLPIGNMKSSNIGDECENTITMNRFMFTTQRRGLQYGQGDPIRGDLPIVPGEHSWFKPSSNPTRDLRTGALDILGGFSESATNLATLKTKYQPVVWGSDAGFGGENITNNASNSNANKKIIEDRDKNIAYINQQKTNINNNNFGGGVKFSNF
jgi:hypothetical protein